MEESIQNTKTTFKWTAALFALSLLMLLVASYLYWQSYEMKKDAEATALAQKSVTEEKETEKEEPEKAATPANNFSGDYLLAEDIATGWSIVEYVNGAGSDMLVSGVTYVGLTGLEVKNASDVVVFKMEGVNGIGGTDYCGEVFQFSDSSATYVQDTYDASVALGQGTPLIVDLSGDTYAAYEFLGTNIRRIDYDLYWDTSTAGSFDAACGIAAGVRKLTTISFEGTQGAITDTLDSYSFDIPATVSSSDLLLLDQVLENLEPI